MFCLTDDIIRMPHSVPPRYDLLSSMRGAWLSSLYIKFRHIVRICSEDLLIILFEVNDRIRANVEILQSLVFHIVMELDQWSM